MIKKRFLGTMFVIHFKDADYKSGYYRDWFRPKEPIWFCLSWRAKNRVEYVKQYRNSLIDFKSKTNFQVSTKQKLILPDQENTLFCLGEKS